MAIERMLKQITIEKQQFEVSNELEKQTFLENKIPLTQLNLTTYKKLLPLTLLASKKEQSFVPEIDATKQALLNAAKLTILFGNEANAIAYLKRFEKRNPDIKQLIHDACLFSLPSEENLNFNLWQALVARENPSSPSDYIIHILPFADKIEEYVRNNKNEIVEEIKKTIENQYVTQFSDEYDKKSQSLSLEVWSEQQMQKNKKVIHKEIEDSYGTYLRKELGIPTTGKPNENKLQELQSRKKNPTDSDKKQLDTIKDSIYQKYLGQFKAKYQENNSNSNDNEKVKYINEKLEKANKTINIIIAERTNHLLGKETPLELIKSYVNKLCYAKANENPNAAELFFAAGIPESMFNLYLSLIPQDDEHLIPPVFIDGKTISEDYKGFYLKKLDPKDPRAAILGKFTSSCQTLGEQGHDPTLFGITNPKAGFYVICKSKDGMPRDDDAIVSGCMAWRSEQNNLVLDSIESQVDFRRKNLNLMTDLFTSLADHLVKHNGISRVLVGAGGETPKELGVLYPLSADTGYDGYRDSYHQRIVADRNLPFVQAYLALNKEAKLNSNFLIEEKSITKDSIFNWCDLCLLNNKLQMLDYIFPYAQKIYPDASKNSIYQHIIVPRLSLTQQWISFIENLSEQPLIETEHMNYLEELIAAGVNIDIICDRDKKNRYPCGVTAIYRFALRGEWKLVEYLHSKGANINARNTDQEQNSILHVAVLAGDLQRVQWLIEKGANINASNAEKETALHLAFTYKMSDIFKTLISHGANVNAKDHAGNTVLHYAVMNDNFELIQYLISHGADINAINEHRKSILAMTAIEDNLETIKWLIAQGAEINETVLIATAEAGNKETLKWLISTINEKYKNKVNISCVLPTFAEAGDLEMLEWLLQQGASVTQKERNDKSALSIAANAGQWEAVKWLLENGAYINSVDDKGRTVLHYAIYQSRLDVFKDLMTYSPNINAQDTEGYTPLHFSAGVGQWDIFERLINEGADINMPNNDNVSILHLLAQCNEWEKIKWLVAKGADINVKTAGGDILLHMFAKNDQWEQVLWLLDHGADINIQGKWYERSIFDYNLPEDKWRLLIKAGKNINAKGNSGKSLLHMLAHNHSEDDFEWLVEQGADINATDDEGNSVLKVLAEAHEWKEFKLLVERGADLTVKNKHGESIVNALETSGWEIIKWLVKEHNIDIKDLGYFDNVGDTLLQKFAKSHDCCNPDILKWIAEEYQADVNVVDHGNPVTHTLVKNDDAWDSVNWLITKGADANAKDNNGNTLLHLLCQSWRWNWDETQFLIKNGADLNAINKKGESIISLIAERGHWKAVQSLISSSGGDINAKNKDGIPLTHICTGEISKDNPNMCGIDWDVLPWLIENGADINAKGPKGCTLLHRSAQESKWDMVRFLIEKNADLSLRNDANEDILDICKAKNAPEDLLDLLSKLINRKSNTQDKTAFFAANTSINTNLSSSLKKTSSTSSKPK